MQIHAPRPSTIGRYLHDLRSPAPYQALRNYDAYWRDHRSYIEERSSLRREQTVRTVSTYLRDSATLLEVGCGPGYLLAALQERIPGLQGEGIDNAPSAVEQARANGLSATCVDLLETPGWGTGKTYDSVVAFEVLEHVVDAERFFRTLIPLAKRNIIFSVPNFGFFKHKLRYVLGNRFPVTVVMDMKEHVRHWTLTDMREWLRLFPVDLVTIHGIAGVGAFGLQRRFPSMFSRSLIIVVSPRQDTLGTENQA